MNMKNGFSFVFPLIFLVSIIIGCTTSKVNIPKGKFPIPPHKKNELIIWRGSNELRDTLRKSIREYGRNRGVADLNITKIRECKYCDDSLEIWSGPAIETWVSGEEARSSSGVKTKPHGEDTLFYAPNFIIKHPNDDIKHIEFSKTDVKREYQAGNLTVAVFDTGIDPELIKIDRRSAITCKPNGENGWNFISDNNIVQDGHTNKHGTVVAQYIIDNTPEKSIDILPVKVLGDDGSGDLFGLFCGMAYAYKSNTKIINASLGFYFSEKDIYSILWEYINRTLTTNGIMLICAAGNADHEADTDFRNLYRNLFSPRDIGIHKFYPASLSDNLPNIKSVTTVGIVGDRLKVSPTQNYSNKKVWVGVQADSSFSFKNPFNNRELISGSSYATPIFTGKFITYENHPDLLIKDDLKRYIYLGQYLFR